MKTTNYINTFIEIAEDCPVVTAEIPPQKNGARTAAFIQFDMISKHPYHYTSDDLIFQVFVEKNEIKGSSALKEEREKFFSKGQACLRSSALGKRYGWGIHCNEKGQVALYPVGSKEYKAFAKDKTLAHVKAMRSKRT